MQRCHIRYNRAFGDLECPRQIYVGGPTTLLLRLRDQPQNAVVAQRDFSLALEKLPISFAGVDVPAHQNPLLGRERPPERGACARQVYMHTRWASLSWIGLGALRRILLYGQRKQSRAIDTLWRGRRDSSFVQHFWLVSNATNALPIRGLRACAGALA